MPKKSKLFAVLAVVWGLFIFGNSLQNGEASAKMSDMIVFRLLKQLSFLKLDVLTVLVRKSAHFCEYAVLSVLTGLSFLHAGALRLKNAGNLLFPCLLWAVADEFLQTFVEGRAGLVRDVVIDFGGILTGCALLTAVSGLRRRRAARG